jgi:PAS domain S-box-containing protein
MMMDAMLQTLIDNVSDGILLCDADWVVQRVNGRAETLLRRRGAEMVGRTLWEALPDVAGTPFEEQVRAAAQQRLVRIFEHFYPSLYAWQKVRAAPGDDGGMAVLLTDTSDLARRQQTEAVREAVRGIVRQVPVAISILRGPEHRFEVVNEMARRLIGGRELEGRTVRDAFPELEGQGLLQILDQVFQTGTAYEGREMPIRFDRTGSGELVDGCFNVVYQPLLGADGRVSGILSISVDVSELVAERKVMSRQAAESRAILSQLTEGVIVTDAEGRIRFVNEAAERMHGGARLDVAPGEYTRAYNLLTEHGEPYPEEQLPLARAVLHDEVVTDARWRIRTGGGDLLVRGSARPVRGEDGQKLGAVLTIHPVG